MSPTPHPGPTPLAPAVANSSAMLAAGAGTHWLAEAGTPRRDQTGPTQLAQALDEIRRLQKRCAQLEIALDHITSGFMELRRSRDALSARNRELRVRAELARSRPSSR